MGELKQRMKDKERDQKDKYGHSSWTERDNSYHEDCSQAALRDHDWKDTYLLWWNLKWRR